MGKYFGLPDPNAKEWWNQPIPRLLIGIAGILLLILIAVSR